MTRTRVPVPAAAAGPAPARRLLRAAAVVACLPHLGLEAAWIAGSRAGIPGGSALLDHRVATAVANGLSMLLDSGVIVPAPAPTRRPGRRGSRSARPRRRG